LRGEPAENPRSAAEGFHVDASDLTERVIGLAIEVHEELGPGLLESAYETCLAFELKRAGIPFRRQVPMPIVYRGFRPDTGFRADLLVAEELVIEVTRPRSWPICE
jgi:GxxExxY protein